MFSPVCSHRAPSGVCAPGAHHPCATTGLPDPCARGPDFLFQDASLQGTIKRAARAGCRQAAETVCRLAELYKASRDQQGASAAACQTLPKRCLQRGRTEREARASVALQGGSLKVGHCARRVRLPQPGACQPAPAQAGGGIGIPPCTAPGSTRCPRWPRCGRPSCTSAGCPSSAQHAAWAGRGAGVFPARAPAVQGSAGSHWPGRRCSRPQRRAGRVVQARLQLAGAPCGLDNACPAGQSFERRAQAGPSCILPTEHRMQASGGSPAGQVLFPAAPGRAPSPAHRCCRRRRPPPSAYAG